MFHFLGFLFIIIIAILLIGLSIIGTVIRSIFGLGSRRSSNTYRNDNGNYQSGRGYSFNGRQQSGSSSNEEPKTRNRTWQAQETVFPGRGGICGFRRNQRRITIAESHIITQ